MNFVRRLMRHTRLSINNYVPKPSPPFFVFFINSICNMKCEHCFYWTSLNKKDDMSKEEIFALSESLGPIENLNLSGGEPFLRVEFAEICKKFIEQNHVREIYVPTNGYFTDKTVKAVNETLENKDLELFVAELSLDGMPEFHDTFRVSKNSFKKAMETYDALTKIQARDPRLRIHCISTATDVNMAEIKQLSTYLYRRCPSMDHHNLAIIRGDRKNPDLATPLLKEYGELYEYIQALWSSREEGRYGSIVEPMLQWAKIETLRRGRQYIPCSAGRMSAVVYANGDVGVCEIHQPLGNLRDKSFPEIWNSEAARELRKSIANKECHCTTEVFMWPSIVFSPPTLAKAMVRAQVWKPQRALPKEQLIPLMLDESDSPVESGAELAGLDAQSSPESKP
jgi:MoaA/NifB/PqqE/SkfB family radical SAM enzyme